MSAGMFSHQDKRRILKWSLIGGLIGAFIAFLIPFGIGTFVGLVWVCIDIYEGHFRAEKIVGAFILGGTLSAVGIFLVLPLTLAGSILSGLAQYNRMLQDSYANTKLKDDWEE